MSAPLVIRAGDRRDVAWKNGGGVTRDVACAPAGAGMETFDWRLSVARVAAPSAFSRFSGIDRILAVLEGRLRLDVGGAGPVDLTPASSAHPFPGDAATKGTPLGGAALVLNLMVRRGQGSGAIQPLPAGVFTAPAGTSLVFAIAPTAVDFDTGAIQLEAHDAVCMTVSSTQMMKISRAALLVTVIS